MLGPLVILALLALTGGWMGWPEALHGSNWFGHFLEPALNTVRDAGNGTFVSAPEVELVTGSRLELGLSGLAMLVAALGWFTAHMFYAVNPELPGKLATSYAGIRTMLLRKYWVDEFYNAVIVQPWLFCSRYLLGSVVETGVVQGGGLVQPAQRWGWADCCVVFNRATFARTQDGWRWAPRRCC